eukprot:9398452-Pyramimonas_sp.AAC.1
MRCTVNGARPQNRSSSLRFRYPCFPWQQEAPAAVALGQCRRRVSQVDVWCFQHVCRGLAIEMAVQQ